MRTTAFTSPQRSAGARLTQRGSLHFDGVRIPASHQLGAEGVGFVSAMQAFDFNRAVIALACIGAAQQSLDETMEHVKQRESFGKPLARHEGVAFQIAEHSAEAIHTCGILNGWAGWGHDLPFNQRLNDVMGLEIGDGTPEIMKAVIAREAMGREFTSYK